MSPSGHRGARLVAGSGLSLLGDGIRYSAGPLLAVALHQQADVVAGVVAVGTLPWLIFPLVSGLLADRLPRRRLLAAVEVTRAAASVAFTGAVATGHAGVGELYLFVFVIGVGETLSVTALSAFLPEVIDDAHLQRANGWLARAQVIGVQMVGPALGGALFALGRTVPFAVDAASFVVSAAVLISLRSTIADVPPDRPAPCGRLLAGWARQIREGWHVVVGDRLLRTMAGAAGACNLVFLAVLGVGSVFVVRQLGAPTWAYGVFLTSDAMGGLVGTLAITRLVDRTGQTQALAVGLVTATVGVGCLAASPTVETACVGEALAGLGTVVYSVVAMTIRQQRVAAEVRGRVEGVYRLAQSGSMPMGAAAGGLIATAAEPRTTLIVAAVALCAITAVCVRGLQSVGSAGHVADLRAGVDLQADGADPGMSGEGMSGQVATP